MIDIEGLEGQLKSGARREFHVSRAWLLAVIAELRANRRRITALQAEIASLRSKVAPSFPQEDFDETMGAMDKTFAAMDRMFAKLGKRK